MAGCSEGRLSFINSFVLKIKRESKLVPGKETGFQKSCVKYFGVYQESNAFTQLGTMLPGELMGRSIVHPPQSYSVQGMY